MRLLPVTCAALLVPSVSAAQYGGCPPPPPPCLPPSGGWGPFTPGPGTGLPGSISGPLSGGLPAFGPSGLPVLTPGLNISLDQTLNWASWWALERSRFLDLKTKMLGPLAAGGQSVIYSAPRAPARRTVTEVILPALLEIVRRERSDDMVAAALVALARNADELGQQLPLAWSATRTHLADSNGIVRESAILALGLFATPEATADLVDLMKDTERGRALVEAGAVPTRLRAFAAHAIGLAATRTSAVAERQRLAVELVALLEAPPAASVDVPVAALTSLGHVDLPVRLTVPAQGLRSHPAVEHVLSSHALALYLDGWAHPGAGQRGRSSAVVRSHAATALARVGAKAKESTRGLAIDRLVGLASDRRSPLTLRAAATNALGEIVRAGEADVDERAREALVDMMGKGSPLQRQFALLAAASAAARPGFGESPLAGHAALRRSLLSELGRARLGELQWAALALGVLEGGLHERGVTTNAAVVQALISIVTRAKNADVDAAGSLALALAARGTEARTARSEARVVPASIEPLSRGARAHPRCARHVGASCCCRQRRAGADGRTRAASAAPGRCGFARADGGTRRANVGGGHVECIVRGRSDPALPGTR